MLPYTIQLATEPDDQLRQLTEVYADIALAVNGTISTWTPTVYGSTTTGSPTYTSQIGYYYRQGIITTVWFNVVWSNAGGADGNILLSLPYSAALVSPASFSCPIASTGIANTANYTYNSLQVETNDYYATVYEHGDAQTAQPLTFAVAGTGGISGTITYMGKELE